MLSRKRLILFLGLLVLALTAVAYTAPPPVAAQRNRQRTAPTPEPPKPPTITLEADTQVVTLCPDEESMANPRVRLRARGNSPDNNPLRYRWNTTGGRIEGEGEEVSWDLTGAAPGVYTATATVESGPVNDPSCTAFTSAKVVVRNCPPPRPVCPNVSIYCPDVTTPGAPITFTASISGGTPGITPTYNWTVSAGTITAGQGTPTITVDTSGLAGRPITATVNVEGYNLVCNASCATALPAPVNPRQTDQYGNIARDDEKARLDNFAIALQNEPGAQGYIIVYSGRNARAGEARRRAQRARDYLVNTRGMDASRVVTLEGGTREALTVELWIVPAGATPPVPR